MGKEFSLLQQLSQEQNTIKEKNPFPPGVSYQEYVLEINGRDIEVFIPLRECETFEEDLSTQTKYLDDDELRKILRKYRGIRTK